MFYSQNVLIEHYKQCLDHEDGKATFPKEEYESFKHFNYKNKVPFTMYADFEAWNHVITTTNLIESSTVTIQKPLSYGLFIQSNYPDLLASQYYEFMGNNEEDCINDFVRIMQTYQDMFYDLLKTNYELHGNDDDVMNFNNSMCCYYCNTPFDEFSGKVRDHDHYKQYNNYRGAACNKCNLQAKNDFVPLFFFNGSKYDNHLIFTDLMGTLPPQLLKVLALTEENYISFGYGCIRVLDAYRFLGPLSLEKLVNTLRPEDCAYLINL